MRCANANCDTADDELLKGTLTLVEFESTPEDRILDSAGGFPVCVAQSRYFWLCQACSRRFTIRKWTTSGLILEPLPDNVPRATSSGENNEVAPKGPEFERRPDSLYGAA